MTEKIHESRSESVLGGLSKGNNSNRLICLDAKGGPYIEAVSEGHKGHLGQKKGQNPKKNAQKAAQSEDGRVVGKQLGENGNAMGPDGGLGRYSVCFSTEDEEKYIYRIG